jgi:zinc transport system substrate-binding protein
VIAGGEALCVFPEANHDPKLVAQIVEGTGAVVGGALDPAGTTLEPGPALYPALITGMADTLAACLAP